MNTHQNRKLAAILFADIVGYTFLMQSNEQHALQTIQRYQSILSTFVKSYNGQIIKNYGDGSLVIFQNSLEAVQAAKAIQEKCKDSPNNLTIPLRIGIHVGEFVIRDGDIYGNGVNLASRLESLGVAGSVLFSRDIYRKIKNHPELKAQPLGSFEFKNVEEPMEVFALANEGLVVPGRNEMRGRKFWSPMPKGFWMPVILFAVLSLGIAFLSKQKSKNPATPSVLPKEKSIAVLPFRNLSQQQENQYFCDGMMDEVLNHLQKIEQLTVKSKAAVEPFRNYTTRLSDISQQLNVNYILEGAVRKSGNQFRISAQLIDPQSGNNLWAETYDGTFSDTIFVVQSNIAQQVASAMEVVISPGTKNKISSIPNVNILAYDYLVRGNHEVDQFWKDYDEGRLKKAHQFYEQSLALEPEYLQALIAKALTYMAQKHYVEADQIFTQVLAIEPDNLQANMGKADLGFFINNAQQAEEYFLRVLALSKDNSWVMMALGRTLLLQKGDAIGAIKYIKDGLAIAEAKPLPDLIPTGQMYLAFCYQSIGENEKSEALF